MPVSLSTLMDLQRPFCLVIGTPISHSLSPLIHNTAADFYHLDFRYYAVNIGSEDFQKLPTLFNHPQFIGANVTIPYKGKIRQLLDQEDETAREIGAVNTIVRSNGKLEGHNTDAYGFTKALVLYKERLAGKKAVVFGSGGASKAIIFGLVKLGLGDIAIISRNPGRASFEFAEAIGHLSFYSYSDLRQVSQDAELFVNTTPLGMEPDISTSPVPQGYEDILSNKICYDIVYKPLDTVFLRQAKGQNGIVIQGLEMFIHQGAKAFELWTGKQLPYNAVKNKIITSLGL